MRCIKMHRNKRKGLPFTSSLIMQPATIQQPQQNDRAKKWTPMYLSHAYELTMHIGLNLLLKQVLLAYNKTFVVTIEEICKGRILRHYSESGQLLKQIDLWVQGIKFRDGCWMLREDEIIFRGEPPSGTICFLSLKNYELKKIRIMQVGTQLGFFCFSESHLLCTTASFKYTDRNRITYYRYDDFRARRADKWVAQYEINSQPQFGSFYQFDNHSKLAIGIISNQHKSVTITGLDANMNPSTTVIDLSLLCLPKIYISFENLKWQLSPGKYIVQYTTIRPNQITHFNLYTFGSNNQCVKSIKNIAAFHQYSMNRQIDRLMARQIDKIMQFDDICLLHLDVRTQETPQKFRIVALERSTGHVLWEDKCGFINRFTCVDYFSVGWNRNLLIHYIYELGENPFEDNNCRMKITVINTALPIRDVYMLMLEHINEDFDDDMLQQAIELLTEQHY